MNLNAIAIKTRIQFDNPPAGDVFLPTMEQFAQALTAGIMHWLESSCALAGVPRPDCALDIQIVYETPDPPAPDSGRPHRFEGGPTPDYVDPKFVGPWCRICRLSESHPIHTANGAKDRRRIIV